MRILIILSILIASLAAPLFAAEVDPSKLELSLTPGKTSETIITVTNWMDYSVKVNIKTDAYRYIFTENTIPPKEGTGELPPCQSWLKFQPNQFELSPKASMRIKCVINVPQGAKEEHVASILFDEEGLVTTYDKYPDKPGNITLKVIPRFTIPLYISIEGNKVIDADISDMKVVEGPSLGTSIKTEITLHNKGTVHLRPSGTLLFMDSKENIIKTMKIGECLPLFPDYKEKIPVYCPVMLEPGSYSAVCTIDIGGGKLLQKKTDFTITKSYDMK
ncbi:MAG: hypothetical protein COS99_01580 [Candidatus Omnitrophica bacterium CG07_land_8_20_14_0_80_42_15]|uniref:Abnormal spindle-like microcephaly-associated protein ASH domain-containing protein n=1 Tax=Candidatus Aquitaenariimonas noxiae TaxID=1974741 RepID=A0A2J0KUL0_9BACT|nr:MAG: hypothetical protein COS99_01580 [Candidatus Omnitrophica bacterium CG07_land_8_20_14_0_80_42_15]